MEGAVEQLVRGGGREGVRRRGVGKRSCSGACPRSCLWSKSSSSDGVEG